MFSTTSVNNLQLVSEESLLTKIIVEHYIADFINLLTTWREVRVGQVPWTTLHCPLPTPIGKMKYKILSTNLKMTQTHWSKKHSSSSSTLVWIWSSGWSSTYSHNTKSFYHFYITFIPRWVGFEVKKISHLHFIFNFTVLLTFETGPCTLTRLTFPPLHCKLQRWVEVDMMKIFNLHFILNSAELLEVIKHAVSSTPILLTRRQSNKLQHILNGNIRKKFINFTDIIFQNIPGRKNVADVQIALDVIILHFKPAILGLGEVDLTKLQQCHHPGYQLVSGRQLNSKSIRVNVLIKNGLEYEELDLSNEVPTCTIKYGGWNLCFIYREWRKSGRQDTRSIPQQNERWDTMIPQWDSLEGKSLVIGDFNHCILHGNLPYQRQFDHIRNTILENFLLDGWVQMVQDETRFQHHDHPSLLDHVYVTDVSYVELVFNSPVIDSDHHAIGVRLRHDGQVNHRKIITKRDIEGIDTKEFERLFLTSNLEDIFVEPEVDNAVKHLNDRVVGILDHLSPKTQIVINPKCSPWITKEIQEDLFIRKRLHQTAQKTGLQEDWTSWKTFRNLLRNKMRRAEENFTKKWLNDDDVSTKWTRIKDYSGLNKDSTHADMEIQTNFGKTKSGPILSRFMNQFFKTKVDRLKSKTSPDLQKSLSYTRRYVQGHTNLFDQEFSFRNTDLDNLRRHLNKLSNTSSIGVDDIPTRVIKKFSKVLMPSILHIINMCLTQSKYPTKWKTGVITPIPKRGDMSLPANWRPIIINCVISKLLERVMNEQLMTYMRENHLDPTTQHAYRQERSCSTAWTELDTFIQHHRDKNWTVALCLTDQSAAFNVLQKDILVGKLQILGFTSSACKLIENYLTGRQTKCTVNGHTSDSINLDSGVGEGSVLGPSLYTLGQVCVSVVCNMVKEEMEEKHGIEVATLSCEYADDVTAAIATKNDHQLQEAVDMMMKQYAEYFSACGLCLNQDKCAVMVIRSKAKTKDIIWNGKPEEKKVKLLGLHVDSKYEFLDHVQHLNKVCSYKLSCIKKISKWLTNENLQEVVRSLVLSQIDYCSEIYLRLAKVRKKVQKLVNAAARVALRENRYANCEKMMKELGWLNADNNYRLQILCSLRRNLSSGTTPYTLQWIDWQTRGGIRTRLIRLSWVKSNKHGKQCFLQAAVKLWNEMELGRKLFANYKAFKDWIHEAIIQKNGNRNLR